MPELSEKAQKALRLWEDGCVKNHDEFVQKLRRRQQAYRAILDIRSDAAQWTSKLTPPWVQHIVDTTLAGLIEDQLRYRVSPAPRFFGPGEYELVKAGAKAHEILHRCQMKRDCFDEKQPVFGLQDAIAGLTVMKNYWRREKTIRPKLKMVPDQNALDQGHFLPRMVEVEEATVAFDGPVSEVVNVEDFFWHEAATELHKSPVIAHRVWEHRATLKRLEAQGVYQNVDELNEARSQGDTYSAERVADGTNRSKGMDELLEIWWWEDDGIWAVTIGNRAVELKAPKKNPFWHGQYPFNSCTTRPDSFSIPGISQVEKIQALQEAHWDLDNQTRDNVRLINNFIVGVDVTRVDDLDALVHEPGARWPVEGPINDALQQFKPDALSAQVALPHLARLESAMQNLAGGQPFTSTSEADTVGANTATEAALTTNLAQQATKQLKRQLYWAFGRVGQQRTELNQQFIRVPTMAESIGLDSEQELVEIAPMILQGDYLFDTTPSTESLMRAERRAEWNSMLQVLNTLLPTWLALSQAGLATAPNFDEFARGWLESYDQQDIQRFFSAKPATQVPPQGAQQQGAQQQPSNGVTAPQSIDPSVSPSAPAALSGATPMARQLASTGGVSNT